jgi:multiple sugar transport system permease protein
LEARYAPVFLLPAFALIALFQLYPMLSGFLISLTDWNGFADKIPVGFLNYTAAAADTGFQTAMLNTLVFVLGCVPGIVLFSLLFASLLNQKIAGKGFFRAVYYLPAITSGVSIAVIWRWIFHTNAGLINILLYSIGIKNMVPWLANSNYAMTAVIITSVWKGLGTNIVLMLAGLQSVPYTLYEASDIDGANAWRKFVFITFPMLSPTVFLVIVMTMINSFQVFDTVLTMTQGGPGNATLVAVYHIYRTAFENFKMGFASATAFILFIVIMLVTILQWVIRSRWVYSEIE